MKVLIAGESWETFSIHLKGADAFFTNKYEEGVKWLKEGLETNACEVDFIPNHHAPSKFPLELTELAEYDVVILSDIGANSLLLHPDTFEKSIAKNNRLKLIKQYVENGGGFAMIGGYMTFQGVDGKGNYQGTSIEEILPVNLLSGDDRKEIPEGCYPVKCNDHVILDGIPAKWPMFLGYNKITAKVDAEVLIKNEEDDFLVVGEYGKGRTAAFASDCAPHWGSPEFIDWEYYPQFWTGLIKWLARQV